MALAISEGKSSLKILNLNRDLNGKGQVIERNGRDDFYLGRLVQSP
jgi:hypothetical protein